MIEFRLAHLGVAVADLEAAIESYRALFGYVTLAGPFDDPLQRVRVCFVGAEAGSGARGSAVSPAAMSAAAGAHYGRVTIELVAPWGEQSPVERVLAQGGGAYHLCYETPDLAAAIAHLRSQRCLLISGPTPAVAFDGRPIAWLYTPAKQLVELVEAAAPSPATG